MKLSNEIEIVVDKDKNIYGIYDYVGLLRLRLEIIEGKITEQLYYINEHGGIDKIDSLGCSDYDEFANVTKLLYKIVQAQCKVRIEK